MSDALTPDPSGPAQAGPVVSELCDYGDGITLVDTHYVRPRLDASHLIVEGGRAAFVDTGTTLAVPRLLAALAARGLEPAAVDWIFLTHVHLDHAGGAGALAAVLPNARVAVHPRGAPHLADPSRLAAATRAVYGEAAYARLYGELLPVPAARLVPLDDGARLALAGRTFEFLHTPGHALHHLVVVDRDTGGVFSGDTFGVSYREFDVAGREFVLPATTPTQFDPAQLKASVHRVLALAPRAVYLTHYGRVRDVARLGADLLRGIDDYVRLAEQHAGAADRRAALRAALYALHGTALDAHGFPADPGRRKALLEADVALNADGLIAWLERRAA